MNRAFSVGSRRTWQGRGQGRTDFGASYAEPLVLGAGLTMTKTLVGYWLTYGEKGTVIDPRLSALAARAAKRANLAFRSIRLSHYWEDVANNPDVSPSGPPVQLMVDGELPKVEIVDETTIRFRTKRPTGLYNGEYPYLYTYILPKHVFEDLERPKQFENVPNVGSGPFIITEYEVGEFVKMERNPEWTGQEPIVDELVYRIFRNEDALAEALKAGEVDFAYFSSANIYNSLENEPNIERADELAQELLGMSAEDMELLRTENVSLYFKPLLICKILV